MERGNSLAVSVSVMLLVCGHGLWEGVCLSWTTVSSCFSLLQCLQLQITFS